MKKRLLTAFLALWMLLSLSPAASAESFRPESRILTGRCDIHANPLYPDVPVRDELFLPENALSPNADSDTHFGTVEEVADQIREYMTARVESFTVCLRLIPTEDAAAADEINEASEAAFELALTHTGVPVEGDYLRWHWGFWTTEWIADYSDGAYNVTIQYALEYYTTAAQEQELDRAVEALLEELDLEAQSDYSKLRGIYDYICENVTYDLDNVNDPNHTLKFSAYAALVDGTAVCQGYASLFYRLALTLGVDARLIAGDSGGPHAWNIARLNGLYYNLDSTWDAGMSEYRYFLVNETNFTDHSRNPENDTAAFHAAYPMSETDFDPETGKPHTHSYTSRVTDPTCTEDGFTTHTCACGHSYRDSTVPALGHQEVTDPAVAPTCTETGLTQGSHCHVCGLVLTVQEPVPATGHSFGPWTVIQEPTGTAEGKEARHCACGTEEHRPIARLENPFFDVKAADYFFEPVLWASYRSITSGITPTRFGPGESCTRAQVVTFLWRAAGKPAPESAGNPFTDVSESAYYYEAVLWAVEKGITAGMSPNSFSPNSPCTRGQVVTFLHRSAGSPEPTDGANSFSDVRSNAFYYDAVLWAVENGITTGTGAGRFSPSSTCTRAQVVTFLYRSNNK